MSFILNVCAKSAFGRSRPFAQHISLLKRKSHGLSREPRLGQDVPLSHGKCIPSATSSRLGAGFQISQGKIIGHFVSSTISTSPVASVLPVPPTLPAIAGDPGRQALASLGGYAYQVYATCLAWLRLGDQGYLHLEVAEDYAEVLLGALSAVQVKCTTGTATILSDGVMSTINAYVDLVVRNPGYKVDVRLLTTAEIGLERATKHRVGNRPTLHAWQAAAEKRLPPAELTELIGVLSSLPFDAATLQFIGARTPQQLQTDLFSRISWDTGQPPIGTLERECRQMLVNLVRDVHNLPAPEARRVLPALFNRVLAVAHQQKDRVLTRADLLELLDEHFSLTVPRKVADHVLALAAGRPAEDALERLRARSASFASEVDIAGNDASGDPLRLSKGLFVPREIGKRLYDDLHRPRDEPEARLYVVAGDAGHGKTSVLWWLYREMCGDGQWQAFFLPASALATSPGGQGREAGDIIDACVAAQAAGATPVVLIDTVDLLLRDSDGAVAFAELLDALLAADADVVLSTRPAELKRIDTARFPYRPYTLSTYSDAELRLALDTYALSYNADDAQSDPQGGLRQIRNAIALGHPLKDLCAIPLALRMLFEIYSPHAIQGEINVFQLYCQYWQYRVMTDRRSAGLATDAPRPDSTDCSAVAAWLALRMLADGALELDFGEVGTQLQYKGYPVAALHDLLHRGVLQRGDGRAVHFFHQSFFEHAAARGLLGLPDGAGIELLFARCREHPDDPFLRPILQHAMLLAELGGGKAQASAQHEFDGLLESSDLADQEAALYVHTHSQARDNDRARKVRALLLASPPSEPLRIHFLRNAVNMSRRRQAELDDLLAPMWAGASLRVRKHMIALLGRLASRMPDMVLKLAAELRIHEYVFAPTNAQDNLGNLYIELLGNLVFSGTNAALAASRMLGEIMEVALGMRMRADWAAQASSLIGRADTPLIDGFLEGRRERHATWDSAICQAGNGANLHAYCRLWARRWDESGTTLASLLAAAPTTEGPELTVHLISIDQFLQLQTNLPFVDALAVLESALATLEPKVRMTWVRMLAGPVVRRACMAADTRVVAYRMLHTAFDRGLQTWRRTKKQRFELGVASRMLDGAGLYGSAIAELFDALPDPPVAADWLEVPELTPFLVAAMGGGLASAREAYEQIVAAPDRHARAADTVVSRLVEALRDGSAANELPTLVQLIAHTGKAGWLKSLLSELEQAVKNDGAFHADTRQRIHDMLHGPSGKVGSIIVQLLPALVGIGVLPKPTMEDTMAWLEKLSEPEARLHLAAWIGESLCASEADAERLTAWLDRRILPAIEGQTGVRFEKEQYVKCCITLVRRRLLDPFSYVDGNPGRRWADRLLSIILQPPAFENQLTSFGWVISAAAMTNPAASANLFQRLIHSDIAEKLSRTAQRNMSRGLTPALRILFQRADAALRATLLEMAKDTEPLLARSVIQIALEHNASDLNAGLARLRADPQFDADLRGLIQRFRRHHPQLEGMPPWEALRSRMSAA